MEDKKEPMAPQGSDAQDTPAAPSAPAADEKAGAPDTAAAPATPKGPKTPSDAAATQVEGAKPSEGPAPKAPQAPAAAPTQPAAPVAAPAQPAAPQAPAQPAAPAAPQAPSAPAQPAAGPAVAPTQPMGAAASGPAAGPAQPMQPTPVPSGAYPPPPAPGYAPKSGKAVGSLVCGILAIIAALVVPIIGPILGIILGIVAIVLAGKAVREAGRDGKATGGKVCGIVGIVASVLVGIAYVLITVGVFGTIMSYDPDDYRDLTSDYTPPSSSDSLSDPSVPSPVPDMDAEEQAVFDATDAIFGKIASKDLAFVQELAQEFDESFAESMGMSWTELGVDPATLADWAMTDFQYSIDSVYPKDTTATAYVSTTERDMFEFLMLFNEKLSDYQRSGAADNASQDDIKAKIGELVNESMAETPSMTDYYAAVDFTLVDGAWVVDEDSLEEELDYVFGTF